MREKPVADERPRRRGRAPPEKFSGGFLANFWQVSGECNSGMRPENSKFLGISDIYKGDSIMMRAAGARRPSAGQGLRLCAILMARPRARKPAPDGIGIYYAHTLLFRCHVTTVFRSQLESCHTPLLVVAVPHYASTNHKEHMMTCRGSLCFVILCQHLHHPTRCP